MPRQHFLQGRLRALAIRALIVGKLNNRDRRPRISSQPARIGAHLDSRRAQQDRPPVCLPQAFEVALWGLLVFSLDASSRLLAPRVFTSSFYPHFFPQFVVHSPVLSL